MVNEEEIDNNLFHKSVLVFEDQTLLHSSDKDNKESRKEAGLLANCLSGEIRKYGVIIEKIDPKTNEVTSWKKTKGVSVWR